MKNLLTKLFRMAFPLPTESYLGKVIKAVGAYTGAKSEEAMWGPTVWCHFYFLVLEDDENGLIGGPVVSWGTTPTDSYTCPVDLGRKKFYRRGKRWASVWLNAVENGFPQGTVCLNEEGVPGVVATYYCGTFYGTTVSGRRLWTSKTPTLVEEKI
jgi:hypothetical protein